MNLGLYNNTIDEYVVVYQFLVSAGFSRSSVLDGRQFEHQPFSTGILPI